MWGRYTIEQSVAEDLLESTNHYSIKYGTNALASASYTIDEANGVYTPSGSTRVLDDKTSVASNVMSNVFVVPEDSNTNNIDYSIRISDPSPHSKKDFHIQDDDYIRLWNFNTSREAYYSVYKLAKRQTQGEFDTNVSGTQSLYPNNGVSGSYWYVLSGSDSIDPISVSTVVDRWLCIGQQLTITASPSTSIQYGGTISYQYQVQLNDGGWTNIGSKTTATSINYTVPDGTTSIAFRVQASDNMGFTSADWIQSETYAVSKYVSGIAQKLHRKNANGEYDLVHMETDTQIVLMNSGSTLEDELLAILAEIERRGG